MLRGDNILLRSVERRDLNIFYEILSDDKVKIFDGSSVIPLGKEYVMENFSHFLGQTKKYLSILNEKNVVVGYITYEEAKDCPNVYTIGITIGNKFWNRGYGKDAIRTITEFLFMNKGAERIELEVLEFNNRARKCYNDCGFIEEGIKRNRYFCHGKYQNIVIMGLIKEDYFK